MSLCEVVVNPPIPEVQRFDTFEQSSFWGSSLLNRLFNHFVRAPRYPTVLLTILDPA
jgi:hypothetical protein